MTIRIQCTNCKIKLEVNDDLVDKDVRCANCETIVRVTVVAEPIQPTADSRVSASDSNADETNNANDDPATALWQLRTPEGEEYGPIPRDELDTWVREGRVSHDCHLRCRNAPDDWQPANETYPMLIDAGNPFALRPTKHIGNQRAPHRGTLVLSTALLGCFVPFLSVLASVIGTRDIRLIQKGTMDPAGESLTRAGQIIAVVATLAWISVFAVALLVLLFGTMRRF